MTGGGYCDACLKNDGDDDDGGRVIQLSVCSKCKSRRYCSRECQVEHWRSFHKHECKELAQQRADALAAAGGGGGGAAEAEAEHRIDEGLPAVLSTRNAVTGRSFRSMSRPSTSEHQSANVRQSIANLLDNMSKPHMSFVPAAFDLARAYAQLPPFQDAQRAMRACFPGSTLRQRIAIGYVESEHTLLAVEMAAGRRRVLEPTTLAVPTGISHGAPPAGTTAEDDLDRYIRTTRPDVVTNLKFIIIPYANSDIGSRLTALLNRCTMVEHLDLTGSVFVTDDILNLIASTQHNSLEYLSFGQDNRYYPPDDISLSSLRSLLDSCTKLRLLRIFHPIAGDSSGTTSNRGNNKKKKKKKVKPLDPSTAGGPICELLESYGFIQRVVEEAADMKREHIADQPDQFWRADIEGGLISATWYQRMMTNNSDEEAFFAKHFAW